MDDHIAVVAEPGGQYLTHFTPASGKAHDIFKELQSVVNEVGGDIVAIGADGTAVSIGKNGGVCRLFELFRERKASSLVYMPATLKRAKFARIIYQASRCNPRPKVIQWPYR